MKKVTWNKIHTDFKKRHPVYAKECIYWRPHDFATIMIYLKSGEMATYNYDTRRVTYTGDKWKK